ncbi:MAG: hypothetical protein JWN45_3033 [Acidobacteriaceae bacterium]|nr:hypothetical protein [Acidobacteriaceae bacterium]
MKKYENLTLENQALDVEQCYFVNCVVKNCQLFYGGGSFDWQNCTFQNCEWKFRGAARDTIQLLQTIGLLKIQGNQPPPLVNSTSGAVN